MNVDRDTKAILVVVKCVAFCAYPHPLLVQSMTTANNSWNDKVLIDSVSTASANHCLLGLHLWLHVEQGRFTFSVNEFLCPYPDHRKETATYIQQSFPTYLATRNWEEESLFSLASSALLAPCHWGLNGSVYTLGVGGLLIFPPHLSMSDWHLFLLKPYRENSWWSLGKSFPRKPLRWCDGNKKAVEPSSACQEGSLLSLGCTSWWGTRREHSVFTKVLPSSCWVKGIQEKKLKMLNTESLEGQHSQGFSPVTSPARTAE